MDDYDDYDVTEQNVILRIMAVVDNQFKIFSISANFKQQVNYVIKTSIKLNFTIL